MQLESNPRARVALSAAPRLVADGLHRVLTAAGVPVTLLAGGTTEHFDLAIVTGERPIVAADVTIVLDDGDEGRGGGTVTFEDSGETLRVDGLAAVIDFVRNWGIAAPPGER